MLTEQSITAKDNAPHSRTLQGVVFAASLSTSWATTDEPVFLNKLILMIVKQLASQPDLHGFDAHTAPWYGMQLPG